MRLGNEIEQYRKELSIIRGIKKANRPDVVIHDVVILDVVILDVVIRDKKSKTLMLIDVSVPDDKTSRSKKLKKLASTRIWRSKLTVRGM